MTSERRITSASPTPTTCSRRGYIRTKTVVRATMITVTDTNVGIRRRSRSPSRVEAVTDPINQRLRGTSARSGLSGTLYG